MYKVNKRKPFLILCVCFISFSHCRHATVLPADASQVSYRTSISNILITNCTGTCHEHTGQGVRSFTLNGDDSVLDTNKLKNYIQAGSPNKSKLYTSITSLASPMPPDGPMPEGNLVQIYTWIKQGANYSY
jgi:hypothetical protein